MRRAKNLIQRVVAEARFAGLTGGLAFLSVATFAADLPGFKEATESNCDAWGEAAMAQPNGASYEFFAPLLPPPRYVNADFHYYPIVLCPPGDFPETSRAQFIRDNDPDSQPKARLISNGSGLNLRGGAAGWNDVGTPMKFRVGTDAFLFGSLRDRVTEPTLAEGWLPIVEIRYTHRTPVRSEGMVPLAPTTKPPPVEIYRLEAFASTAPEFATNCVVFVRFDLAQGTNGFMTVEVDLPPPLKFANGCLLDASGRLVAAFDSGWKYERGRMVARLGQDGVATLALPSVPLAAGSALSVSPAIYADQRAACVATWQKLVGRGMAVEVPEPLVNHAWRNALCQNFQLINHGQLRYSTGNQYDRIYSAEGSDAARALLVWGYEREMRRLMEPLFDFTRKGLELHQAAFKIDNIAQYYWQTRDAAAARELRPRWEPEAERLATGRTGPNGLYPREQYCGDIFTPVQSLNVNAEAWRTLRDLGTLLGELGQTETARRYASEAAAFRPVVLRAVAQAAVHKTTPPFVPIALDGGEAVHDPILHYRIGAYWNIIIGYTIGSGIFPPGSAEETWIPHYQEQHGGIFLGMVKAGGAQFNFWTSDQRVNPLYGTRYTLDTLRRDDPERALVSFYGMLAQGLTRNTFVGGEGCTINPVDAEGRFFFCPPNSAASAHVLSMLRYMLVQDWDLDDDGKPDTLRLAFATPRRWLEPGKTIKVERAPTAFGPVSVKLESHLAEGKVIATVDLPQRNPARKTLLRARLPEGWKVFSVAGASRPLSVDDSGTVDLSGLTGKVNLVFLARKQSRPARAPRLPAPASN